MTLTVLTPPGEPALSLDEAKSFLRIGHDGEDALVEDFIESATAQLEAAAGLALVARSVRRTYRSPMGVERTCGLALRPGPASALDAVHLVDASGVETDLTARFMLLGQRLLLRPGHSLPFWSGSSHLQVDFTTGFGGADDVPADLVQALKLLLLEIYRRNDAAGLPEAVIAILAARREVLI